MGLYGSPAGARARPIVLLEFPVMLREPCGRASQRI